MNFEMNLEDKYFKLIKTGKKQIEIRLNYEKRRAIKPNDTITFINNLDSTRLECVVKSKREFKSFRDLYNYYPKSSLGYLPNEAASYTDMFSFYNLEDMHKFGVVAIEIQPKMPKI